MAVPSDPTDRSTHAGDARADPAGGQAQRPLQQSPGRIVDVYDVALLDLDGVVYIGQAAAPHAVEALAQARDQGMRLAYVTNNASRTPATIAEHLHSLGVPATAADVVTSAQAAARVMAELVPPESKVLVVGGAGLRAALTERGLRPVGADTDDPAAVIQGFAPHVDWALLAEGAYALHRGLPWVASNTDMTIPTTRGRAPGNGTLVEVLRLATGRVPVVTGKPEPPMHREAMLRTGARNPLVVGDRLDTDIAAAERAGVASLLVLTGVTHVPELMAAPPGQRPTYLSRDLRGLLTGHADVTAEDGWWRCGTARARLAGGEIELADAGDGVGTSDSDGLDVVRVTCAAAWSRRASEPIPAVPAAALAAAGAGA